MVLSTLHIISDKHRRFFSLWINAYGLFLLYWKTERIFLLSKRRKIHIPLKYSKKGAKVACLSIRLMCLRSCNFYRECFYSFHKAAFQNLLFYFWKRTKIVRIDNFLRVKYAMNKSCMSKRKLFNILQMRYASNLHESHEFCMWRCIKYFLKRYNIFQYHTKHISTWQEFYT